MSPAIQGMGVVFAGGRGVDALDSALRGRGASASPRDVPGVDTPVPCLAVAADALEDKAVFRGMRRADRLCKMAVMAASDAWHDAAPQGVDPTRVGVAVATALGPHVRTFQFLDGILDFGDDAVSPTIFSHSVHNAAASYVTSALRLRGPALTVTDFEFAFQHALTLAELWLAQGRCDMVLAGAVEELGEVMLHVCARLPEVRERVGAPHAHASHVRAVTPGEGAAFFALSPHDGQAAYAAIETTDDEPGEDDLVLVDATGLTDSRLASATGRAPDYSHVFGHMLTGSAFQCAAAALSLKHSIRYPSRATGGRVDDSEPEEFDAVYCLKPGRNGHCARIVLRS